MPNAMLAMEVLLLFGYVVCLAIKLCIIQPRFLTNVKVSLRLYLCMCVCIVIHLQSFYFTTDSVGQKGKHIGQFTKSFCTGEDFPYSFCELELIRFSNS